MENNEIKESKVAICERCGCYSLASLVKYIDEETELEFTEMCNAGLTVKIETKSETQARGMGIYQDCINSKCKPILNSQAAEIEQLKSERLSAEELCDFVDFIDDELYAPIESLTRYKEIDELTQLIAAFRAQQNKH